jgi:ribosomal protein L3 glutamine methyltransferase
VTLGEALQWAEKCYARERAALGQVADNAHDEALYLILKTLGLPLDSPPTVLSRRLSSHQRAAVQAVLQRRLVDRVPAAYLTHEAWLGPHRFYVDERVIIPRSYFLEAIPELDRWAPDPAKVRKIADVCTGSGCLAVLLAKHFPRATVDAIDLSEEALAVAKINVRQHRLARRITLYRSDVFDALPPMNYDIILSNPPYEPSAHVDRQSAEFKAEPRLAHDGGADGMVIIRKLVEQARSRLERDGVLIMEVGGLRRAIDREYSKFQPRWLPTADGTNCIVLFRAEHLRG